MNPDERAQILDRLAAGQISAVEAMRLLEGGEPALVDEWAEGVKTTAAEIPIEELKTDGLKAESAQEAAPAKSVVLKPNFVPSEGDNARWLKIQVSDMTTGRRQVNITLPVGLVSLALGIAKRFNADMRDKDTDELEAIFKSGQRGMLVDVEDEDDNKKVQIFLD